MSFTPSYSHSDAAHLARLKVGTQYFYLKDSELRAVVEAFGNAVLKDSSDAVSSTGVALPTQSAVYSFVLSQIGDLGSVLNLLSASKHTDVTTAAKGDFIVEADGTEWLYDGTEWREIGSENAYVLKTTEIAGIALSSNISSTALSSALGLDALAFKSSASGTLSNYVDGLNGAEYTPAGSVSVTLKQTSTSATLNKGDYTPSGNVSVTLSQTSTNATVNRADYVPAGTLSIEPAKSTVKVVTDDGSAGTFSAGSYTAPSVSEATAAFATAGLVASVGTGADEETLIFTAASTANALTGTGFNAGSYTAPSLTGLTMPTTTSIQVDVGISSATFSGTTATDLKVTGVSYDKATVSAASFSGSKAENILVTGVSYNEASVSATSFSGTSATITPTLTSSSKNVSVS